VECANLVARLPGRDSALKAEHVVLSAHLDHLGIGAPINGDKLYNGALDNASGVAVLLDLAAAWHAHPANLQSSVLFVVVTGEEKGLLGSKFFARQPTVPAASMVAEINFDMFLPIFPLKRLKVAGIAESDLGDRTREAAAAFNVQALPDPEPLRNTFIRSDQYNFIKQGIPAVKIDFGYELGSPEHKLVKDWLSQRYHAPSDDLAQPVDIPAAGQYENILRTLVTQLANTPTRPQWKSDSFFKRYGK
jgi:Zn-dependent M28 family amino/carboxypeptidase